MSTILQGKKIAVVMANEGVEQVELTEPVNALRRAGATVELASPEVGKIQAMHHMEIGDLFESDIATEDLEVKNYAGLLLPGGVANPDILRMDNYAVKFVRDMHEAGKPIAAICHGPWMLVEADIVRGLTLTSWPSLQTDIRNAGGTWVNEEVHTDARIITSRRPFDIPAFNMKMLEEFSR